MKVNFTPEHEKQLKDLYLELGFSGAKLEGKFGANTMSADQLLHTTTIETLKGLKSIKKKEIDELEKEDEWTVGSTSSKKLSITKKWYEYINLLIGYKLFIEQVASEAREKRKQAQDRLAILTQAKDAAELKRIQGLTPEELEIEIQKASAHL